MRRILCRYKLCLYCYKSYITQGSVGVVLCTIATSIVYFSTVSLCQVDSQIVDQVKKKTKKQQQRVWTPSTKDQVYIF